MCLFCNKAVRRPTVLDVIGFCSYSPKSESCLGCASLTGSQFRRCLERHCTPSISHSSILPNINGKCSLLVNLAKDECDMEFDKVSNFLEPNRMKTLLPPAKRIWGDPLEVCIGTRCNGMMGNIRRMCIINRCYNTK